MLSDVDFACKHGFLSLILFLCVIECLSRLHVVYNKFWLFDY